ncbi:MAG TPA: alpha/beta hydrolase, partial [Acidimicrobiia bacterium]|nr:alpha/beta hydrolase [Acidimicrobiia bacterium]
PVLVREFDVVGFDPRGVGESTPVTCTDGATLDRINHIDPVLDTQAKLDAAIAGAKELAADCEATSGRLLPYLSTRDEARDLDAIRAALGDATLTYFGISYGTVLGAEYANLFPTHVRALALDGAVDPAVGPLGVDTAQAVGFEHDLNDFLADCAAQGAVCPFQTGGAPTLRAAFDALVAGIRAHPLPAGGGRLLGPAEAVFGIAWPLYLRDTWPDLADALAAAQRGDGGPLLSQFDGYVGRSRDGTYANREVAGAAIGCLDQVAPTVAGMQAAEPALAAAAPYFGPAIAHQDLVCAYWPVKAAAAVAPLHAPGTPPILVVGSTGDPATPYAWARGLAAELGSGVLLTRHGDGHGAYEASACARAAIDRYLTTLAVPTGATADCAS